MYYIEKIFMIVSNMKKLTNIHLESILLVIINKLINQPISHLNYERHKHHLHV
jgi:hypothetical protein